MEESTQKMKDPQQAHRIAGVQISTQGAKRISTQPAVNPSKFRQMNIAHHGMYFSDSRKTGFTATDVQSGALLGKKRGIYILSQVSHNWSWQIASNNRILTEGLLMFDTTDGALDLMTGRLGNSVSGGYIAPTKPLIADGRIIYRMPDKLVCYDLRQTAETAKTEVITLTAKDAAITGPVKSDIEIRIRKRGDDLISLAGRAPYMKASADMKKAVPWWPQDWSDLSWYRTVDPVDVTLNDEQLSGPSLVAVGYNYEPFTFELQRDGDAFAGTYTRTVRAFDQPIAVEGIVKGPLLVEEDGHRVFVFNLDKAGISVADLTRDRIPKAGVWLVATVNKDNELIRMIAHADRVNRMTHEVAVDSFVVNGNHVKATVTVLTHDDKYGDLDVVPTQHEFRSVGTGGAVAMRYEIETLGTEVKDEKSGESQMQNMGTYKGTIGVPFTISGEMTGTLSAE
jgi:hypothetical protein